MIVRVDDDIVIKEADEVSFLNQASFGPGERFGITDEFEGRKVFINVNNMSVVEVDCTDEEV
jgi:hypothetical protein